MSRINLESKKFGMLTVVSYSYTNKHRKACWNCICECGKKTIASSSNLLKGSTKSCGCLKLSGLSATHRLTGTSTYNSWAGMVQRCTNNNTKSSKNYIDRGIKVCDSWLKFENFYNDMGICPSGLSLDRIDNNGDYNKENCRWATKYEQANNKRSNKMITYNGKTKTMAQWSTELGISKYNLKNRLSKYGWTVEKSFNTPIGNQGNRLKII